MFKNTITVALTTSLALLLSSFQSWVARSQEAKQCQAYTVETNGRGYGFREVNNCPLKTETFSIIGTFSNANWRVSITHWEPAAYIYKGTNLDSGRSVQIFDFDIAGTTNRPQYRFTKGNVTRVVTFRYSDPDTIRLEIFQNNRRIFNQLLNRQSNERPW